MVSWKKSFSAGLLVWGAVFLGPGSALTETLDRVVAKVNGDIITLSSVEERASLLKDQMRLAGNGEEFDRNVNKEELMKQVLENLIDEKLQIQEAKKTRLTVGDDKVLRALEDIKRKNGVSDADLQDMLLREGRTMEQYKNHIRDQILVSQVVGFELSKSPKVSKKKIRNYYQKHRKDYWVSGQAFFRHILFILDDTLPEKNRRLKRIKAREVLRQVRAGRDFNEAARKYSEDVSAGSGGEIGFVSRGQLVPAFEEVAFDLKPGQVSDIVKTRYGLHIIKKDKEIPGRTKPLKEVKKEIERILAAQNRKEHYHNWMKELKKSAFIEVSLFRDSDGNGGGKTDSAISFEQDQSLSTGSNRNMEKDTGHWEEASRVRGRRTAVATDPSGFDAMERKLSYIKQLREKKKISESEYLERKKKLLDQL